ALPTMCNCFEPWKAADPVPFQLLAVLPHPADPSGADGGMAPPPATEVPSTVTVTAPEKDATAATVASCVKDQVARMTFTTPVKTLIAKCKDLLKTDDAWLATLQKQLEVEQQKKDVVVALVKEDGARWSDAEKSSTRSVDAITSDVAKSKTVRKTDEGACPVI